MPATIEPTVLDLQHWRGSSDIRVLAGRDVGEDVRKRAGIDALDSQDEPIEVNVPADLFSVTSSFFLGLFGSSIRKLGEQKFRAHYLFRGKRIDRVIEDAIRSVLLTDPLR